MNLFNIAHAFARNKARGWPTTYFAIDIHDTIFKGMYKLNNPGKEFYPWAKEVLLNLTNNPGVSLILYTSSHPGPARDVEKWLMDHGIRILDINHNPDHRNTELCDFSKKFHFDVLLDDKAGFEGWRDWFLIMKELQRIGQWTESEDRFAMNAEDRSTERNDSFADFLLSQECEVKEPVPQKSWTLTKN